MTYEKIVIPPYNANDSEFDSLLSLCGDPIGHGSTRVVYAIPEHPGKVLKVSKVPSNATNWAEAVIYIAVTEKSFFGEIFSFSLSGKYLVMEFLADVTSPQYSNLDVPLWWNDKKPSNLGISAAGQVKIRDYAMLSIEPGPIFRFP